MITKFICPYSKTIIHENNQIASYLRWTSKKNNITVDELKLLIYQETFSCAREEIFKDFYINKKYSLPDFLKNFGMNYQITQFLIKTYNLPKGG